jgi:hypothetical protein
MEPGQAASAPGSASNEPSSTNPAGGVAGQMYAGNGQTTSTPANGAAVSQYGEETSSEEQLEDFGLLLVAHRRLMGTEFGRCHSGISGNSLRHGPEPGTYENSSRRC